MAESRRQLIEGSSFLRNEKEKIGGLNVKRSTISGDAFKKEQVRSQLRILIRELGIMRERLLFLKIFSKQERIM